MVLRKNCYISLKYLTLTSFLFLLTSIYRNIYFSQIRDFFSNLFYLVYVLTSVALILYPIVEFFLMEYGKVELNQDYFYNNITDGTITLRITSILVGYLILKKAKHFAKSIIDIDFHQNSIYGFSILLLWLCKYFKVETLYVLVLNFTVFFIVDDWRIVSKSLINSHLYRAEIRLINLTNLAIVVLVFLIIYNHFWGLLGYLALSIFSIIVWMRIISKIK